MRTGRRDTLVLVENLGRVRAPAPDARRGRAAPDATRRRSGGLLREWRSSARPTFPVRESAPENGPHRFRRYRLAIRPSAATADWACRPQRCTSGGDFFLFQIDPQRCHFLSPSRHFSKGGKLTQNARPCHATAVFRQGPASRSEGSTSKSLPTPMEQTHIFILISSTFRDAMTAPAPGTRHPLPIQPSWSSTMFNLVRHDRRTIFVFCLPCAASFDGSDFQPPALAPEQRPSLPIIAT